MIDVDAEGSRADLDSHADTGVGGGNTVMIEDTGIRVQVNAFSPEHDAMPDIPVATVAGAYDCPDTGSTFVLVWHQWLYFGARMPMSLVNANQLRSFGHVVEETPRQFDHTSGHCIRTKCGLTLPLKMHGVVSYIPMRAPTDDELADPIRCPRIEMTSEARWDPHSNDFARNEDGMRSVHATQSYVHACNENADHTAYFARRPAIASMSITADNLLFDRLQRKLGATGSFAGDHLIAGVTTWMIKKILNIGTTM